MEEREFDRITYNAYYCNYWHLKQAKKGDSMKLKYI